jgi:hypothetical protein
MGKLPASMRHCHGQREHGAELGGNGMVRELHLLCLIAMIPVGLTAVWFVSSGRAQPRQAPRPTDEISNPQAQTSSRATFALEGTALLTAPATNDIREEQRQQIIRYFTSQIAATPAKRDLLWRPNFSSLSAYRASVQKHRVHLREMLGLVEPHLGTPQIKLLHEDANLRVEDVTLPMDSGFDARALVFSPRPGPTATIRGKFYVSAESPAFTGMAFKLARTGNPGNLIVRSGRGKVQRTWVKPRRFRRMCTRNTTCGTRPHSASRFGLTPSNSTSLN